MSEIVIKYAKLCPLPQHLNNPNRRRVPRTERVPTSKQQFAFPIWPKVALIEAFCFLGKVWYNNRRL